MKYFIIIDMQNDFCTGSLANDAAVTIIPKIAEVTKQKKAEGYTVIATRDTHYDNYMQTQEGKNLPVPHCINGTKGWDVVDEIKNLVDLYIDKPSFGYAEWKTVLKETPEVIELCGTVTSICVASNATMLKAAFPEVPVYVHENLCADLNTKAHEAALTVMKAQQVVIL